MPCVAARSPGGTAGPSCAGRGATLNRFAQRLEDERAKRGLSLTEFARDVLKVPLPNVSKYINTDRHPERPQMRQIAAALGVPVAELDALLPEKPPRPGEGLVEVSAERLARIEAALARIAEDGAGAEEARGDWVSGDERSAVRVRDDGLRSRRGVRIPAGAIVWLNPATAAEPGQIVRVGTDEPVTLRVYDPADPPAEPVTAVGWLAQILL